MAAWKQILLSGDAALLESASAAVVVTTVATAGIGSTASRWDHAHTIDNDIVTGAMILDKSIAATNIATGTITANEIEDAAVGASEIASLATMVELSQIQLTPKADGEGTVEGTLFYDSDDNHLYIYTV